MKHTHLLSLLALLAVVAVGEEYTRGVPVNVGVGAGWRETPIALEAAEFLAKSEGDAAFWAFAEALSAPESAFRAAKTSAAQHSALRAAADALLPPSKRALLSLALASRALSPTVAFHAQLLPLNAPADGPFAVVAGALCRTAADVSAALGNATSDAVASVVAAPIAGVDHTRGADVGTVPDAILYAHLGTEEFSALHAPLREAADAGKVAYTLRHRYGDGNGVVGSLPAANAALQGYGVEFALKSVEYKTIDEPAGGNAAAKRQQSESATATEAAAAAAVEAEGGAAGLAFSDGFDRLTKNELAQIGDRAVVHIVGSENPLQTLRQLAHDFPALATSLARTEPPMAGSNQSAALDNAVLTSQVFGPGTTRVLVNGKVIDKPHDNWYDMLELVGAELAKAELLSETGLVARSVRRILSHTIGDESADEEEDVDEDLTFDIRSPAITWINNLDKERMYVRFGHSVNDFLRPVWPGNLHYVAKNLVSIVIVADPGKPEGIETLANFGNVINQLLPMRVGVLLLPPMPPKPRMECTASGECTTELVELPPPTVSLKLAKAFHALLGATGNGRLAMTVFSQLNEIAQQDAFKATDEQLRTAYEGAISMFRLRAAPTWEDAQSSDRAEEELRSSWSYAREAGLAPENDAGLLIFANGVPIEDVSHVGRVIGMINIKHTPMLQKMIREGALTDDDDDLYSTILARRGALPKFSHHATPATKSMHFHSLLVPRSSPDREAIASAKYFFDSRSENMIKTASHIVCADLETEAGRKFAADALDSMAFASNSELLRVPTRFSLFDGSSGTAAPVWSMLHSIASRINSDAEDSIGPDEALAAASAVLLGNKIANAASPELAAVREAQRGFCARAAAAGGPRATPSRLVVSNGRIVAPIESDSLSVYDFSLLSLIEARRAKPVLSEVDDAEFQGINPDSLTVDLRSDVLMRVASLLGASEAAGETFMAFPKQLPPSFETGAPADTAFVAIDALVDPLSREAQRFAPILEALSGNLPVRLRVFLNPMQRPESLPLKVFYRYSLDTQLSFDATTGDLQPHARLSVEGLPATRLLTLGMDVPHPWIVMASEAVHDLDNIRLGEAAAAGDASVDAMFRLEHILVEGNCHDARTNFPPRGLELELDADGKARSDTIVMSNFGYFQLKAEPGLWHLRLRPGRSTLLYEMPASGADGSLPVVVNSFLGKTVDLRVSKKPGHEHDSLLVTEEAKAEEDESRASLWDRIFGKGDEKKKKEDGDLSEAKNPDDDKVHVFSIASGHLYERFLKIMVTSVVNRSSVPVKFWFIKNYLSPAFKDSIAGLAREFGFEYELVTYKWPSWLFPQTEKQRLIWGYKVLFLDVIFPIGLKKVIYVDADQVVRGDLKELMDLDLHGAPVGMTPFCQGALARQETLGFRFWASGYWHEHLRGKPYHISALFVVDLQRFRRMAAGDQYRAHYDGLARDPNSLSNLDQDLPNYLQSVVPIYSLPPEWLWCETWCTDECKPRAKTIDLCNNPMTKTPKLESAKRIIPEWEALDENVRKAEEHVHSSEVAQQQN